jgi:hypothetical protein
MIASAQPNVAVHYRASDLVLWHLSDKPPCPR